MTAEDVARKIVENLESETPKLEQILKRPSQESSNELRAIEEKDK
jgi:hypothetical protein